VTPETNPRRGGPARCAYGPARRVRQPVVYRLSGYPPPVLYPQTRPTWQCRPVRARQRVCLPSFVDLVVLSHAIMAVCSADEPQHHGHANACAGGVSRQQTRTDDADGSIAVQTAVVYFGGQQSPNSFAPDRFGEPAVRGRLLTIHRLPRSRRFLSGHLPPNRRGFRGLRSSVCFYAEGRGPRLGPARRGSWI
jgi:hypothetical protein